MSSPRFAPMTASLLARKGDATPSGVKPPLVWMREPTPAPAAAPPPPPDAPKPRRMMVTLSAGEFEKLGIAAVKKGVTRHHIVRTALDSHFARLACEYGACGCMAGSCGASRG